MMLYDKESGTATLEKTAAYDAMLVLFAAKERYEKMKIRVDNIMTIDEIGVGLGQRRYAEACLSAIRTIAEMIEHGVKAAEIESAVSGTSEQRLGSLRSMAIGGSPKFCDMLALVDLLKS